MDNKAAMPYHYSMLKTISKYRCWTTAVCLLALVCMSSTAIVFPWMRDADDALANSDGIFYTLENSRKSVLVFTVGERARLNPADHPVPVFQGKSGLFIYKGAALFPFHEAIGALNRVDAPVRPIRAPPVDLS